MFALICFVFCIVYVFFFKQKTAYEMRISDWSSDVCSSDLRTGQRSAARASRLCYRGEGGRCWMRRRLGDEADRRSRWKYGICTRPRHIAGTGGSYSVSGKPPPRSEEHTSELQSLMRISYAVLCLKKKTINHNATTNIHTTV